MNETLSSHLSHIHAMLDSDPVMDLGVDGTEVLATRPPPPLAEDRAKDSQRERCDQHAMLLHVIEVTESTLAKLATSPGRAGHEVGRTEDAFHRKICHNWSSQAPCALSFPTIV